MLEEKDLVVEPVEATLWKLQRDGQGRVGTGAWPATDSRALAWAPESAQTGPGEDIRTGGHCKGKGGPESTRSLWGCWALKPLAVPPVIPTHFNGCD